MGEISTFDMKKAETIYWRLMGNMKTIQHNEAFKELLREINSPDDL